MNPADILENLRRIGSEHDCSDAINKWIFDHMYTVVIEQQVDKTMAEQPNYFKEINDGDKESALLELGHRAANLCHVVSTSEGASSFLLTKTYEMICISPEKIEPTSDHH